MSVYAGPEISNNGLVYSIDAANDKSYSRNHFLALGSSGPGAASDNNVTFPVNGTGTFVRLGYGQTFGGYTIQPNDVVYKYVLGGIGCHYHGFDTTILVGAYATFSFDYYISPDATSVATSGDASLLANFENAFSNAVYLPNTQLGVWQRISFTSGPRAVAPETLRALLYPGGCTSTRLAASGYILYKNPIVEFSQTRSPGIFTSRTANNTVTDISGSNITSTLNNGATRVNDAFVFDGTDDCISLGNASNIIGPTQSQFSINTWVKSNVTGVYKKIFTTQAAGTSTIAGVYFSIGDPSYHTYLGLITNNGSQQAVYNQPVSTTQFTNICGTYDGSNIRLYYNGVLVATQAHSGNIINTGVARISGYDNNAESWNGSISNLQIYNRTLTAAEIKQNFNALRGRYGI